MKKTVKSQAVTKKDLQDFATKKDLEAFATKKDLHDGLLDLDRRFQREMQKQSVIWSQKLRKEIVADFRVITGELAYDYRGIFKDRTEQISDRVNNHEDRLQRIESRLLPA